MALAWKAGWVNSPRGFESRILRHVMSEDLAGGGVCDADVAVVDEHDDAGSGVGSADTDGAARRLRNVLTGPKGTLLHRLAPL
jgi:hypothetical protein